jgi:hypothetical protein
VYPTDRKDDVIERQKVVVAEVLGGLSNVPDGDGIGADFTLGKHHANVHGLPHLLVTTPPDAG